jgi:hypothetical protein
MSSPTERATDIGRSNGVGAVDAHRDYESVAEAIESGLDNMCDTLAELGLRDYAGAAWDGFRAAAKAEAARQGIKLSHKALKAMGTK